VLAELIGHVFVTALLLLSAHWVLFLLNVPMTAWLIYRSASSFLSFLVELFLNYVSSWSLRFVMSAAKLVKIAA